MKCAHAYLLLIATGLFMFPACSKDEVNDGYIKGKIDGVPFSYTTGLWATNGKAGDRIIAFRAEAAPHYFRFYLNGAGSDINPGDYIFQPGTPERSISFSMNNEWFSAGQFSCFPPGAICYYGSGKITIRSISKNRITGSFECVTNASGTGVAPKTVTEGEFDIERD